MALISLRQLLDHAAAVDLLDPSRLADCAAAIDDGHRGAWPPLGRDVGGTAYLCVIDADGMGVSLSQSNFSGLGTTIGAGDAGFLLQNRGGGFTLQAGHPNRLGPGKRPLHTIFPTSWTVGEDVAGKRVGVIEGEVGRVVVGALFEGGPLGAISNGVGVA